MPLTPTCARGGQITKLAAKLKLLKQSDPVRTKTTDLLIDKLFGMGLIPTKKSLLQCEALPVSAFCRRRLPVVLVRLKFCETLKEAVTFVEQGHIRVGAAPFCALRPPCSLPSAPCAPVLHPFLLLPPPGWVREGNDDPLLWLDIDMEDPNSN